MVSLYKRANPAQKQLLRIIEGAVRNALHHHQKRPSKDIARSIAKRAVGTLTAYQPEVLAVLRAPSRKALRRFNSPKGDGALDYDRTIGNVTPRNHIAGDVRSSGSRRRRGPSQIPKAAPSLAKIHKGAAKLIGYAKRDGKTERVEALIDAMRMISQLYT